MIKENEGSQATSSRERLLGQSSGYKFEDHLICALAISNCLMISSMLAQGSSFSNTAET